MRPPIALAGPTPANGPDQTGSWLRCNFKGEFRLAVGAKKAAIKATLVTPALVAGRHAISSGIFVKRLSAISLAEPSIRTSPPSPQSMG